MRPLIYLSFAYAFSEFLLMLVKRSKDSSVKTRSDKGSLIFLWLMITAGFTTGFFLSKPVDFILEGFGLPLIIGGLIIRWIAILQLGNSFTVDVAITDKASLKTDGIYEKIRHPSYLGMLLVVTGFAVTMSSFYSFLVLVVPVFTAIIYRISIEEKVLISEFGSSYTRYMESTKKIIPRIF
jgi:protein-S-isoprenylcysteine O-methyltransferase Ste14